jgi:restriction system protein
MDDYEDLMLPLYRRLDGAEQTVHSFLSARDLSSAEHGFAPKSENIIAMDRAFRLANQLLADRLLEHVYAQTPRFFEQLVVDLMLALGYGNNRTHLAKHLGQSHDGGVDGVIACDVLGLELVFLQAKRLRPNSSVSVSQVRDFMGSLDMNRATKGIFVTTGTFSSFASDALLSVGHRIRLIDGKELSRLMIKCGLGAKTIRSFEIKAIDASYFVEPAKTRDETEAIDGVIF